MGNKKITLATVKSFIRKNKESLFIDVRSKFDGMYDGCMEVENGFIQANKTERFIENTLGIAGAWFVGRSDDYFTFYKDENYTGVKVSNSCGRFILAIKN